MRVYVHYDQTKSVFETEHEFQAALDSGVIPRTAAYWRSGMSVWSPVCEYTPQAEAADPARKNKRESSSSYLGWSFWLAALPFLLTLPMGLIGLLLGGKLDHGFKPFSYFTILACALVLFLYRMPLPRTAKIVGSWAISLAVFCACMLLPRSSEAPVVDPNSEVGPMPWGRKESPSAVALARPTPITDIADHRLDRNGDSWPDLWPAHWKKDGDAIDFSQITDSHLLAVYEVMLQSEGPVGETSTERLLRLGRYSTDRDFVGEGADFPTAEIVPVDDHWLTLNSAQVAAERLKHMTGIDCVVKPSLALKVAPFSKHKVEATALLEECLKTAPEKTKTLRFFVTGARAILPELDYNNYIFYHSNPDLAPNTVLMSAWAIRPSITEVGEGSSSGNRDLWAKLTGIRLSRNMIAPVAALLGFKRISNEQCLSNMGVSVESMDKLDALPSGEFLSELDRWIAKHRRNSPEGSISPEEVATMMMREAWKKAANKNLLMLHTLSRGATDTEQIWNDINYAISPNPVPGSLEEEQMDFSVLLKTGRSAVITYTWFHGMPHTVFFDARKNDSE